MLQYLMQCIMRAWIEFQELMHEEIEEGEEANEKAAPPSLFDPYTIVGGLLTAFYIGFVLIYFDKLFIDGTVPIIGLYADMLDNIWATITDTSTRFFVPVEEAPTDAG